MKAFVYILQDKNQKFYIGFTTDITRRLIQHSNGQTHTTARMQSPQIVLKQEYPTLEEARSIERKLKKLKRKDYIKKIVADGRIKMKP